MNWRITAILASLSTGLTLWLVCELLVALARAGRQALRAPYF